MFNNSDYKKLLGLGMVDIIGRAYPKKVQNFPIGETYYIDLALEIRDVANYKKVNGTFMNKDVEITKERYDFLIRQLAECNNNGGKFPTITFEGNLELILSRAKTEEDA